MKKIKYLKCANDNCTNGVNGTPFFNNPEEHFNKNVTKPNKLQTYCKKCSNEYDRQYRLKKQNEHQIKLIDLEPTKTDKTIQIICAWGKILELLTFIAKESKVESVR